MKKLYFNNIIKTKEYQDIVQSINGKQTVLLHDCTEEALLLLTSVVSTEENKQIIVLTADDVKAYKLYHTISLMTENAYHLRSKQSTLYGVDALSRENMNSRLAVLDRIVNEENIIVVASIEAYTNILMDKNIYQELAFNVDSDMTIDIQDISHKLIEMGYSNVSFIEGKGQFTIRGGIVDIFSPYHDNPCRIELFDNEIDSLRIFDPKTQRSIENVKKYRVIPCCEILLNPEQAENVRLKMEESVESRMASIAQIDDKRTIEENLKRLGEKAGEALRNGDYMYNIEFFSPYLPIKTYNVGDYLKSSAVVVIHESNAIRESRKDSYDDFIMKFTELYGTGQVLSEQESIFKDYDQAVSNIKTRLSLLLYNNSLKNNIDFQVQKLVSVRSRDTNQYYAKIGDLASDINRLKYNGYKIYLELGSIETANKIQATLKESNCDVALAFQSKTELLSGQAAIIIGYAERGIDFPDLKLIVLTEKDIIGSKSRRKKTSKKHKASKIDTFTDLKPGDYVVHEHHGIGIYKSIEKIEVKGIQKDYLAIHYRGGDKLFVPVDQMDLIQKYIGSESIRPKINKMTGPEWFKAKARAQRAIDDMAEELIELYSKRQNSKGFSFSQDNEWQRGFENSFPYQETEDQLRCIDEIKEDMMRPIPMDRLLCGDVGFGKTEVALRAIFKAVMDGKQAVILVPTTILAQQHFTNMVERFKQYPVKIEMLSRFRTPAHQKKIIENLNKGLIDVVVGTHKLLSKEVKYKDLGLLVIDEEQRFGVRHKELIKQIRTNIDVLTLTATPIPRTLNMSMIGIRDMSIIEEPPGERYPIQTFVMELNESFIKEAIIKEVSRGGQVYFIHNRVRDINEKAEKIRKLVPGIKIAVAHGQMSERQLENIMIEFINREHDVLVCTTIIETGMDIANVNTMVISNADKLGLAQLYQLRGRVGRSNKTAFAYLTYEKDKVLTEIAEKRLKAIKEFTEFGSGFKIAMRDLEIRGAGNIIGSQQSGHLAAIGYDLYVKMMERTLNKKKTDIVETEVVDTIIELDVDGFIPSKYISDEEQKIEIYKKISVIENKEDVNDVLEEIIDRFGNIPQEVNNLIKISYIKSIANNLNVIALRQIGTTVNIEFNDNKDISQKLVAAIMENYQKDFKFDSANKPILKYFLSSTKQVEVLNSLENMFEKLYNYCTTIKPN
ncbi:MAG: transcription-repair coupling factor [Dethiosulfatibacter sp.]|nr:transcription-repair coupling factor [Dethiosulfatibacter sp.]